MTRYIKHTYPLLLVFMTIVFHGCVDDGLGFSDNFRDGEQLSRLKPLSPHFRKETSPVPQELMEKFLTNLTTSVSSSMTRMVFCLKTEMERNT